MQDSPRSPLGGVTGEHMCCGGSSLYLIQQASHNWVPASFLAKMPCSAHRNAAWEPLHSAPLHSTPLHTSIRWQPCASLSRESALEVHRYGKESSIHTFVQRAPTPRRSALRPGLESRAVAAQGKARQREPHTLEAARRPQQSYCPGPSLHASLWTLLKRLARPNAHLRAGGTHPVEGAQASCQWHWHWNGSDAYIHTLRLSCMLVAHAACCMHAWRGVACGGLLT